MTVVLCVSLNCMLGHTLGNKAKDILPIPQPLPAHILLMEQGSNIEQKHILEFIMSSLKNRLDFLFFLKLVSLKKE